MTCRPSTRRSALVALAVLLVAGALLTILLHDSHPAAPAIAAPPPGAPARAGFAPVVARALPSVVQIRSPRGLGSGVVLDAAGHVVTNAHVVAGARSFRVTLADGSQDSATLRGAFAQGDLAVVQLQSARPRPAVFADSSRVRVGDYALAIGNPLGLRSSVTQGVVSSTSRTVPESGGVALRAVIQTSAPINPGNSGGALVDSQGAVIGIPTLAATDAQLGGAADGIGFAIASNTVRSIAAQLAGQGRVVHSGRAWLGVELRTLPGAGVVVAGTTADGPAARAGLRPGDIVVRVAERPITSVDDVAAAIAAQRPRRVITIGVRGPSGTRSLTVRLGELPASAR
jgi:putative serine protease PepD